MKDAGSSAELVMDLCRPNAEPERFHAVRFDLVEDGSFDLNAHLWDTLALDARVEYHKEMGCIRLHIHLTNPTSDLACRPRVGLRKLVGSSPRWMIPGIFYKHNRVAGCRRMFPAYHATDPSPERMLSNAWSFRSDRAATPAVFLWNSLLGAFVITDERLGVTDDNRMGLGMTGVYFRSEKDTQEIGVLFPHAETPLKYSYCRPDRTEPEECWINLPQGLTLDWEVFIGLAPRDLHSYAKILAANAARIAPAHPIRPWITAEQGEELAVEGLLRWHANAEQGILYETASFEKQFGKLGTHVDRMRMHIAWVGGAPVAYALLWHGHQRGDADTLEIGRNVLDRIAEGISPIGTSWPEWAEDNWSTGRNPEENWIHARTLAEATLYLVRALRLELYKGATHPTWLDVIRGNLDFALRTQREDGNFGSCYDVETGAVTEWDGCAGLSWIGALIAGYSLMQDPTYRAATTRAGNYYARFIEDEFLYGSQEDHFLAPSCQDGYCALVSYLLLYEMDRDPRWLELACRAADWALSFRYTYNVTFSRHTLLGMYEFRTRGGDMASPVKHALHVFGLMAYTELLKLSALTGKPHYRERAEEQRLYALQFIAREDGDFGARKGMMPDEIYPTDWWQPKGRVLALSHAWCLGAVLGANLAVQTATTTPSRPWTVIGSSPPVSEEKAAAPSDKSASPPAVPNPLNSAWSAADPRETREIKVKWKIF